MQKRALAHSHRGVQDHDPTTHAPPKHARNTNETSGPPSRNIRWETTISYHRSKLTLLEFLFWVLARTTTRRTDPQIPLASPSHRGALSRAHAASLARTHATQSKSKSKSISRLGGRAKAALITPNLRYKKKTSLNDRFSLDISLNGNLYRIYRFKIYVQDLLHY